MSQNSHALDLHSRYQSILDRAIAAYDKKTGKVLATDSLLPILQTCQSPNAVLNTLQEQIPGFDQSQPQSSNTRSTRWLNSTINVLYAFSTTFGGTVGQVYPPVGMIFAGIGILLSAAKAEGTIQDTLTDVFERIEGFFHRLETYIEVTPTAGMIDTIVKIMVQVLVILAIATKELKQSKTKKFMKRVMGKTEIEDALLRLDKLTQEEARMATVESLKATHDVDGRVKVVHDEVTVVKEKVTVVDGKVMAVRDQVTAVDDKVMGVSSKMKVMHDSVKRFDDRMRDVGDQVIHGVETIRQMANDLGVLPINPSQMRQSMITKWLSPPDPSVNFNIARNTKHKGTTVWFTQGDVFTDWKKSGSLLWINGKPGSGKSVLVSAIIQDIECISNTGSAHMAYFFFDFKDIEKQDSYAFLSSVLFQLSSQSPSFCDILLEVYSAHQRGSQQPSDVSLAQCLETMLKISGDVSIYIIIDALDECPDTVTSGKHSPRENVLELVKKLVELHVPNLRICVTSRLKVDIQNVMEPLTSESNRISLHDEAGQKKDIADYINSVVYLDPKMMNWREEDKKLVMKTLSDGADGMFRWVSCQIETLRDCLAPSVRRVLKELPETLDGTYERILREIPKANRVHAHRLLQCLAVAVRPLRVQELAEVLAVDFNSDGGMPKLNEDWRWEDQEKALLTACSSLITVVDSRDYRVVQFSHFSVKEFLTSDRLAESTVNTSSYHHIQLESAHAIMAQACLGVLLHPEYPIDKERMKRLPLADYAAKHFADHAEFGNVISGITNGIDHLLDEDKPYFSAWMSRISSSWWKEKDSEQPKASPLYYVADLGFCGLVQHLISKRPQDVKVIGGAHGTPLHAALRRRHMKVIQLLLTHCVGMDIRDSDGQTPLHVAASNGLLEVTQMIIDQGVDINVRDNNGWTPLHQVVDSYPMFNERELDIMRLLLDHGADVGAQDNDNLTPLHMAAYSGQLVAAKLLIELGGIVDAQSKLGRTPLHHASWRGNLELMQLLMEHGADIEAKTNNLVTPLHMAAQEGNLTATGLLLEHGAIAETHAKDGTTPLHQATLGNRPDVVQLLLEHGVDADTKDDDDDAPLHLAAQKGNLVITELLVKYGASVHAVSKFGRTPLHHAAWSGSPDVMQLLLERGANVDTQTVDLNTPLHLAAREGKLIAARLLIEHGAIADLRDKTGWTPLHNASLGGYPDVIRLLLEHGVDSNAQIDDKSTSLHIAAQQGEATVVQLLLEHGASVHLSNKDGWTPLHQSVRNEHLAVMQILLEHGADLEAQDIENDTPLHLAAQEGKLAAAKLFLERGASVHAQNIGTWTPLHHASRGGYLGLIQLLLDHDADTEAQNKDGDTPLQIAARQGKSTAVQVLLEHGARIDVRNKGGWTLLHHASLGGDPDFMRLVLEYHVDVDARDYETATTPLHLAAYKGDVGIAQVLLENGANVDARDAEDRTPLHHASSLGHPNFVQLLLDHGVDVEVQDSKHQTPLFITAAGTGDLAVAQLLLEHGADVHRRNKANHTPLHQASWSGYADVTRLFLQHGADLEVTDNEQDTPLHLAAHNGKLAAAQMLLEHGAVVHVRNKIGWTPLHKVSWHGYPDIAELLLEHRADADAQDNEHLTPLHLAVTEGKMEVIQLLLEYGANVHARNKDRRTPFQFALSKGNQELVQLLSGSINAVFARGPSSST